jgi:hypothetical protein
MSVSDSVMAMDSQMLVVDEEGEVIATTDLDTAALDFDVMSVLKNQRYKGDLKWLQYYNALLRYLYKKDPSFNIPQFNFDVHEDSSGNLTFVLRRKKPTSKYIKYVKYLPSLVGPLIGAAFTVLFK